MMTRIDLDTNRILLDNSIRLLIGSMSITYCRSKTFDLLISYRISDWNRMLFNHMPHLSKF